MDALEDEVEEGKIELVATNKQTGIADAIALGQEFMKYIEEARDENPCCNWFIIDGSEESFADEINDVPCGGSMAQACEYGHHTNPAVGLADAQELGGNDMDHLLDKRTALKCVREVIRRTDGRGVNWERVGMLMWHKVNLVFVKSGSCHYTDSRNEAFGVKLVDKKVILPEYIVEFLTKPQFLIKK